MAKPQQQKANKSTDYTNLMTPVAPLMYINLGKPDSKYDKYGVTIVLDRKDKDQGALIEKLETMNQEAYDNLLPSVTSGRKQYRAKTLKEEEDDEGNETGRVLLKAITLKQPPVFDAALPKPNRLGPDDLKGLWSGTTGRCKLSLKPSVVASSKTIGLTVYLSAVQIVEPIYGEQASDFDGIEGGFSSSSGGAGDTMMTEADGTTPEGADF